ncbi:Dabb family protein [Aquimarina sp. AU474]|uniref:Dabb family protein n=1 Tax=Aquimarina sp. AU474 TaxID=2108529 RepID=UPI000D690D53|nr:Dabb family protein [Aquimarina sp. AU474]
MKFSIVTLLFFITFSSIAQTHPAKDKNSKKIEGPLVHTVLFWLQNPDNEKERKAFENGVNDLLDNCKSITSSHFGIPANTEKRPVIDTSYTYCIVVTFESIDAHDKYQVDPIHKKFIKENQHLWSKVLIYDSSRL